MGRKPLYFAIKMCLFVLIWTTSLYIFYTNAECDVGKHLISSESGSTDFIWTGKQSSKIGDASVAAVGSGLSFVLGPPRVLWLTLNPTGGNEFDLTKFCIEFQFTARARLRVNNINDQLLGTEYLRFTSSGGMGKGCFNLAPYKGIFQGVKRVKLNFVRALGDRDSIIISNVDVKGCVEPITIQQPTTTDKPIRNEQTAVTDESTTNKLIIISYLKCIGKQKVTTRDRSPDFLWRNRFGREVSNDASVGTGLFQSILSREKLFIHLNSDALGESTFILTSLCADFSNTMKARFTLMDDTDTRVDFQTMRFNLGGAVEHKCYDMGGVFDNIKTIKINYIVALMGESISVSNISLEGCLMLNTQELSTTDLITEEPTATEEPNRTEEPMTTGKPNRAEDPTTTEEPNRAEEPTTTEEPNRREEPPTTEEPNRTEEHVVVKRLVTCHSCVHFVLTSSNQLLRDVLHAVSTYDEDCDKQGHDAQDATVDCFGECYYQFGTVSLGYLGITIDAELAVRGCSASDRNSTVYDTCIPITLEKTSQNIVQLGFTVLSEDLTGCYCDGDLCNAWTWLSTVTEVDALLQTETEDL